jgi:hypothetical protein
MIPTSPIVLCADEWHLIISCVEDEYPGEVEQVRRDNLAYYAVSFELAVLISQNTGALDNSRLVDNWGLEDVESHRNATSLMQKNGWTRLDCPLRRRLWPLEYPQERHSTKVLGDALLMR